MTPKTLDDLLAQWPDHFYPITRPAILEAHAIGRAEGAEAVRKAEVEIERLRQTIKNIHEMLSAGLLAERALKL